MKKLNRDKAAFRAETIRARIEEAEEAIDALWSELQGYSGKELQEDRDRARDAIDSFVAAGGFDT